MKLLSFEVQGLMGSEKPLKLTFNPDLNVITGRNGSGKTSILKLIWYMASGNILLALKEVNFKRATLTTDLYQYSLSRLSHNTCKIDWNDEDGHEQFEDIYDEDGDVYRNAEDLVNAKLWEIGSSVFFPTFRRIEGGFTLGDKTQNAFLRAKADIEEVLVAVSKRLSHKDHVFVTALSTQDVETLLVQKYTDLSEEYNNLQQSTSQGIIAKIKAYKFEESVGEQTTSATGVLDQIRIQIEGMEGQREHIMRPLEAVRQLAMRLFRHSGIKLGKALSFGDAASAVNSDSLSAGEKQMLSFIAYNAFYNDSVFVVDEPELSLHVDWQRQLFPILLSQQASNQFLIATHSPFIYSKYPDREIQVDPIRGDEEL